MANPIEDLGSKAQDKSKDNAAEAPESAFDPLKLWSQASSVVKEAGVRASEAFKLPSFDLDPAETEANARKPSGTSEKKTGTELSAKSGNQPELTAGPLSKSSSTDSAKTKSAQDFHSELADKVMDRIHNSDNPVEDIKSALKKLDNLKDASITMNGKSSHVELNLLKAKTVAPPNFSSRGFRPVASHIDTHISFDLTPSQNGTKLENVSGLSASVRGPLGRIRHSETNSMIIGKDKYGAFVQSSSDLYMRRRVHTSTNTLREGHFPEDSPIRSAMQHPDALEKLNKTLRLFQDTSDLKQASIKRNGSELEVKSVAAAANHVELNYKPEGVKLPVPFTVESLDLDKGLSASLKQGSNSVGLENISGLKVNVKLGEFKASVAPSKVAIENDKVKMELKNPEDGSIVPFEIPVAKLKEATAAARKR